MKHWLSVLLFIFISGCSVQITDMTPEPTVQKFDLTDADGDGVILARDRCGESFDGAKVKNDGCSGEKTTTVRHALSVNFANNSYIIKPIFFPEIEELADFMKDHADASVTIEGHTSKLGGKELNRKLSLKRAQAVKNVLVNKFLVDEKRILAVGYGAERLLSDDNSEYGHASNRRIVAEISSEKPIKDMKWTIYSTEQSTEQGVTDAN